MKRTLAFWGMLLCALYSSAQVSPVKSEIYGTIVNNRESVITYNYEDMPDGPHVETFVVDSLHHFHISLDLYYPSRINISNIGTVFIKPGEKIEVAIDMSNMVPCKFPNSPLNDQMAKYRVPLMDTAWPIIRQLFAANNTMEAMPFKKFVESKQQYLLGYLDRLAIKQQMSATCKAIAAEEINYMLWEHLTHHLYDQAVRTGKMEDAIAPEGYNDYLAQTILEKKSATEFSYTLSQTMLGRYSTNCEMENLIYHQQKGDTADHFNFHRTLIEKYAQIKDPYIGSYLMMLHAQGLWAGLYWSDIVSLYPLLSKAVTQPEMKPVLEVIYRDAVNSKKNSGVAMEQKFLQLREQPEFNSVITDILKTSNGKYIYIDLWATWCAPCMAALPHSVALEEKVKDKVSFVYLCNQSSENDWQAARRKYHLKGQHYLLSTLQYGLFKNAFNVKGIPRYVLLSPQGVVINDDMSRPQDPATLNMFSSL